MKHIKPYESGEQIFLWEDFKPTEEEIEWLENGLDRNRKGDLAEYYAVTWLWDQGYEVFKNCGCTGPIDMIAFDKNGEVILIDVKTAQPNHRNSTGNRVQFKAGRTKLQEELDVQFLLYNPDTRGLRFAAHGKKKDSRIKLHQREV